MKKIMQFMMAVAVLGLIAFNTGVDIENNNDTTLTLEGLKAANANPWLECEVPGQICGGGGNPGGICTENCTWDASSVCFTQAPGGTFACNGYYP